MARRNLKQERKRSSALKQRRATRLGANNPRPSRKSSFKHYFTSSGIEVIDTTPATYTGYEQKQES